MSYFTKEEILILSKFLSVKKDTYEEPSGIMVKLKKAEEIDNNSYRYDRANGHLQIEVRIKNDNGNTYEKLPEEICYYISHFDGYLLEIKKDIFNKNKYHLFFGKEGYFGSINGFTIVSYTIDPNNPVKYLHLMARDDVTFSKYIGSNSVGKFVEKLK